MTPSLARQPSLPGNPSPEEIVMHADPHHATMAAKGDGTNCHLIAALSLEELLNRLDEIVAGR